MHLVNFMDKITVGNFLVELRNEKKLTQEQLAEKMNVGGKTISKWECGNSMPDLETLVELAEFYDVSLYELIQGKRVRNIFITKKSFQKVINKNSLTKIVIIKIISAIILLATIIFMTISTIYAFNNYNQFATYEMSGGNDGLYIDGIVVKNRENYYFSISKIDSTNKENEFLKDQTKELKYYVSINETSVGDKKYEYFDTNKSIKDALIAINFHISNEPIKKEFHEMDLYIEYKNTKNENIAKNFKIILEKKHSNDKVFY